MTWFTRGFFALCLFLSGAAVGSVSFVLALAKTHDLFKAAIGGGLGFLLGFLLLAAMMGRFRY